jgi:hypothetical protein
MTDKQDNDTGWEWGWRHRRNRSPWFPGVILILIGGFFLLRNYTGYDLENWWALFILIPAVGSFSSAYESYRSSGTFDRNARHQLFWGLFFTLLSGSFLLSLDFGLIWPFFLILGGLGMLLGAL